MAGLKTYGDLSTESITSTQVGDDQTYAVAGNYSDWNSDGQDIYLIKVDSLGNVLLSKTYKFPEDQYVRTLRNSPDGGFILGGKWAEDAYLMKLDHEFKSVWISIFGGYDTDYIYSCRVSSDSEIVACGYTMSYGMGDADIFLLKLNMAGQIQWAEAIGSGFKEATSGTHCLSISHDGDAILAGYIDNYTGGAGAADAILLKVDKTGELHWAKTYGGTSNDYGFMVQETSDSGFIINGYTTSYSQQTSDHDGFLIKTDENGALDWSKIYGTDNSEVTGFGYQDSENSFIFSGEATDLNSQQKTIYVVKTDSSGYSGCEDKTIEIVAGEPELVVTPIQDMILKDPFSNDFPLSVTVIEVADSVVCDTLSDTTSIGKNTDLLPKSFKLNQNYPNPFNPVTTIEYSIPRSSTISLRIYNVNGQEVRTLIANKITAVGNYTIEWDGRDDRGKPVASGTYFYQLESEGFLKAHKMIMIK